MRTNLQEALNHQLQFELRCANVLCEALNYPRFCDDQKNFPGATEADGYVTGELTLLEICEQAAKAIKEAYQQGKDNATTE